jgi:hypothetical protein
MSNSVVQLWHLGRSLQRHAEFSQLAAEFLDRYGVRATSSGNIFLANQPNHRYLNPVKGDGHLAWIAYAVRDALYTTFSTRLVLSVGSGPVSTWNPSSGLNLDGTVFVEQTNNTDQAIRWLPKANLAELLEELGQKFMLSMFTMSRLAKLLEELGRNFTLSMFAMSRLRPVTKEPNVLVTVANSTLVFKYDKIALLGTYGAGILLSLAAVVVGLQAFRKNGVSMKTSFLSIIATTRNPDLDELARGTSLGAEGTLDHMKNVKARFGQVSSWPSADANQHAAFGMGESGVEKLDRNVEYI